MPGSLFSGNVESVELIYKFLTMEKVMFRFPGVFIAPIAFPPDEIFPFALLVLPFVYNPLYLKGKAKTVLERIHMNQLGSA